MCCSCVWQSCLEKRKDLLKTVLKYITLNPEDALENFGNLTFTPFGTKSFLLEDSIDPDTYV